LSIEVVKKFSAKAFPIVPVLLPTLVLIFLYASITVSHGVLPEATSTPGYDTKMLRREFTRAQDNELKNFEIREKTAAQRFKQNQKLKQSTFDLRERDSRRKYFAEPHPGAEKRAYMKDLLARREVLKKTLADETAKFQSDAETRLENLVDEEHAHRADFEKALKNGERPADSIWPQPGTTTEPAPQ
jgi:hypothetical protein